MPFFRIPEERMEHLSLFGYDKIGDALDGAWYSGPLGRTFIRYSEPVIWLDDITDAMQIGATAIVQGPDDS